MHKQVQLFTTLITDGTPGVVIDLLHDPFQLTCGGLTVEVTNWLCTNPVSANAILNNCTAQGPVANVSISGTILSANLTSGQVSGNPAGTPVQFIANIEFA